MPKYQPVSSLLSSSSNDIQTMLKRARYLQSLTRMLREQIDPVLSSHIAVANLRGDTAIITADSPAWLSKIRYLAPVILQLFQERSELEFITNIQFKVQPPDNQDVPNQHSRQVNLSAASSSVLDSAAAGIDDPDLANALRRLSRAGAKPSD